MALALLFGWSGTALGQGSTNLDLSPIDRLVRAEMELNGIPGLSVAIVQRGELLLARAYGVKHVETGEPMEVQTLVDLASVSKSFTARAVWQLSQEGALDLDSPVARYLPEFRARGSGGSAEITLRRLLQHRSGFTRREDHLVPCCGLPGSADLIVAVRKLSGYRLRPPIDASFRYANCNYVLLAAIAERVSGEPFPSYLRTRVFEPLGLRRTTLNLAEARQWGIASYHERQWGRVRLSPSEFSGWYGSSGVKSNAADMAAYIQTILAESREGGGPLLKAADGPLQDTESYEMGWLISPRADWLDGQLVWEHTGDIWGANTAVVLAPELRSGAVVLANAGANRAGEIARAILRLSLGMPASAPRKTPWHQIPDNWAMVSVVAAVVILICWVSHLHRVRRQFQEGERRFRWNGEWMAVLRAALLLAMAGYLLDRVFAGPTPLVAFPTTLRMALPLLTGAVVALLATHAVLGLAPLEKKG